MEEPEGQNQLQANSVVLLSKIKSSGALGVSERKIRLLEYLVTEELAGRGDRIKAYSIGVDVLGKDENFDPSTNNAVRVEMGRLREALSHFYTTNDTTGLAHIEIPVGTYRPIITNQSPKPDITKTSKRDTPTLKQERRRGLKQDALLLIGVTLSAIILFTIYSPNNGVWSFFSSTSKPEIQAKDTRIPVSIRKFTGLSENNRVNLIATSISEDLSVVLSRNKSLAVTSIDDPQAILEQSTSTSSNNGVIIDGYVRQLSDDLHIVVELIDHKTKVVIWAQAFHEQHKEIDAHQDDLINRIAGELRTQLYNASRRIISGEDPKELSPWELYLMATWLPGEAKSTLAWEQKRVELAEFALQRQPDFGPAHSVLSDKIAYLAAVDPPSNSPEALKDAAQHAQKAMELSPHDADVFFNLSIYEWHVGHIEKATRSMKRVLELDPSHTMAQMLSGVFPYTCSPAPLSVLRAAQAHDASLSPENPVRWVTLTWLTMLQMNSGELKQALATEQRTHQIFQTPDTIVRMAVIMNQLGDLDGAKNLIASQKQNWPNLSVAHFANITMPRRCAENDKAGPLVDMYRDLAAALKQ